MGGREKSSKNLQVDLPDIDLSKPRYGESTYGGRLRHFLGTTSVLNVFVTPTKLEEAKTLVNNYQNGKLPSDAFKKVLEQELWRAKRLKESAFHPDSGERIWFFGRMSFQVPGNMVITGLMMTYYTRTRHVILLQAMNQFYNAISFYCNRGAADALNYKETATAFAAATGAATGVACALNYAIQNYRIGERMPKIVGRFVPLVAVAAAHSVNSPIMRWSELTNGIRVENEGGEEMGRSKTTARKAITETVISRIGIALVVMGGPPMVIDYMNKRKVFQAMVKCATKDQTCLPRFVMQFLKMRILQMKEPVKFMESLVQVPLVGLFLAIGVPLFCALFRQRGHIPVIKLESDIQDHVERVSPEAKYLFYNKGL